MWWRLKAGGKSQQPSSRPTTASDSTTAAKNTLVVPTGLEEQPHDHSDHDQSKA